MGRPRGDRWRASGGTNGEPQTEVEELTVYSPSGCTAPDTFDPSSFARALEARGYDRLDGPFATFIDWGGQSSDGWFAGVGRAADYDGSSLVGDWPALDELLADSPCPEQLVIVMMNGWRRVALS